MDSIVAIGIESSLALRGTSLAETFADAVGLGDPLTG
jgi:hypothetical protein